MLGASILLADARRTVLGACERNMNALVKKGSRRCCKAVRAVDAANAEVSLCMPIDKWLADETRTQLRVRCRLCPFLTGCKAPLTD